MITAMPSRNASRRHSSLTLRLAFTFALLAFLAFATLGVALYRGLERELIHRDDAALTGRVDQLRTILNNSNTLEIIRVKSALFQNMIGNKETVLSIGAPGQKPMLIVNPGNLELPLLTPVPMDQPLLLNDVQHLSNADGTPFAVLAASFESGEMGGLQVSVGRLMTDRTMVLANYRLDVFILAGVAAALLALCGYILLYRGLSPLRRLAEQAKGIGVSNLTRSLDGSGAPRELVPMIDALNAMLDRLSKGFLQLGQVSTDMAHECEHRSITFWERHRSHCTKIAQWRITKFYLHQMLRSSNA